MSTYRVGTNDRGDVGYVSCPDEWAQRKVHWQGYVVSGDDFQDVTCEPYKQWAIDSVRKYLEQQ